MNCFRYYDTICLEDEELDELVECHIWLEYISRDLSARYYFYGEGNLLGKDPIRNGMNWYIYANGNPLRFIDPSGLAYITLRSGLDALGGSVDDWYWTGNTCVAVTSVNGKSLSVRAASTSPNYTTYAPYYNTKEDRIYVWDQSFYEDALLTSSDRVAGVTVSIISQKPYRDISEPVNNAVLRDTPKFRNISDYNSAASSYLFSALVGNTGLWNLKYRNESKGEYHWEETLGISFGGYNEKMLFYGQFVTVEAIGNITYGYLGKEAGFSDSELYLGSAGNHLLGHRTQNWDNEKRDQAMIRRGIEWNNARSW